MDYTPAMNAERREHVSLLVKRSSESSLYHLFALNLFASSDCRLNLFNEDAFRALGTACTQSGLEGIQFARAERRNKREVATSEMLERVNLICDFKER